MRIEGTLPQDFSAAVLLMHMGNNMLTADLIEEETISYFRQFLRESRTMVEVRSNYETI